MLFISHDLTVDSLPWIKQSTNTNNPSFTSADLLLGLPPQAVTVVRTHKHRISAHQQHFHAARLTESVHAFGQQTRLPTCLNNANITSLQQSIDSSFASLVYQIVNEQACLLDETSELLVTILVTSTASNAEPVLVAHTRVVPAIRSTELKRIQTAVCGHSRWLASFKHSQWLRDRASLDAVKQLNNLDELLIHSGSLLIEGLVTNIAAIDQSGTIVVANLHSQGLHGYYRDLVLKHDKARQTDITVDAIREGRFVALCCIGTGQVISWIDSIRLPKTTPQCTNNETFDNPCTAMNDTDLAVFDRERRLNDSMTAWDYVCNIRSWMIDQLDSQLTDQQAMIL